MFIHRFATRATRRSAIWDCGYPDPSAATQYTGSSFAMPIRRVFGTTVFRRARDGRHAAARARRGPARYPRQGARSGLALRLRPAGALDRCTSTVALNQLQFLTIRSYLTLVFATLVLLLLVVAAWR